jgi:2-amino-4-hydroxy-6-hydroxymethyldihydropteridine diphosphokinase
MQMIIISLGANMPSRWGDAASTILEAFRQLDYAGITVIRRSALYVTTPLGVTDQPDFVNAAAAVSAAIPPIALLSVLKKIEAKAGRKRTRRWGPRALDLDIIDYQRRIINWPKDEVFSLKHKSELVPKPELVLPHPQAHRRPFVLQPLSEVAPHWHHPVFGQTTAYFLTRLRSAKGGHIKKMLMET